MNKKGQAAMEFLMTYGWAILAAVIVIAVLAYFGVFSPSTYVPNQCILSAPFGCNAGAAGATDGISLEIKNGAGEALTITSIVVSGCGTVSDYGSIASDAMPVVTVACDTPLTEGDKFKGDISITYTKAGSAIAQTSSGSIVSKVVA